METNQKPKGKQEEIETEFPGYPLYPPSEDIYSKGIKEDNIDPENIDKLKEPNEKTGDQWNEADYRQDSGNDLDIPGSEYDDNVEDMGMEDEENNYYSLGSDNHSDLEENNTDIVTDDSENDAQDIDD
jgi:hypothetical protein